jgi:hypothetical protein
MTANLDHLLAHVEAAGLDVAAAYDSGDPLRIDRAAMAYIDASAAYMGATAHPAGDGPERQALAAELAAMGPESVMTEPAPCCGYPEMEAGS